MSAVRILSVVLMFFTASAASAATVTLDWTSGRFYSATTPISSVSSNYTHWPTFGLGLYVEKGYEVLLVGELPYDPDMPVTSPGTVASNDPGVELASVRQVITHSSGRRFALSSMDVSVGANQQVYEYTTFDPTSGTINSDYVERGDFDVTVDANGVTTHLDPHSHVYNPDGTMARQTQTYAGGALGAAGTSTTSLSIGSAHRSTGFCDPRYLAQLGSLAARMIDCSNPSATAMFHSLSSGAFMMVGADSFGPQNWTWTFNYTPTLTTIPVSFASANLALAMAGLVLVGRRAAAARQRARA